MTILCLPRPRDSDSRFLKTYAAAWPSFRAVSAVTGSTLAVPRTPSVPKILFLPLMLSTGKMAGDAQNDKANRGKCRISKHEGIMQNDECRSTNDQSMTKHQ